MKQEQKNAIDTMHQILKDLMESDKKQTKQIQKLKVENDALEQRISELSEKIGQLEILCNHPLFHVQCNYHEPLSIDEASKLMQTSI